MGIIPEKSRFHLENILTYALSPKAPSKADQYRHVLVLYLRRPQQSVRRASGAFWALRIQRLEGSRSAACWLMYFLSDHRDLDEGCGCCCGSSEWVAATEKAETGDSEVVAEGGCGGPVDAMVSVRQSCGIAAGACGEIETGVRGSCGTFVDKRWRA
jgi:hypothetical protein